MDLLESDKNWEKSIFPKVLKLAERLATEAQRHSEWHKRMNSHNLNQSGAKVEEKGLSPGDRVYFYRPPTQQEIARRDRKAKHLAHYHGPAIVQGNVEGREEQVDEAVRDKRSRMKLVISTSLGQAWLINHPSCNLAVATHSVFFTETTGEESLQTASSALFCTWYMENVTSNSDATFSCPKVLTSHDLEELVVGAIDRLMTGGMSHESDSFALITPRDERAQKRAKRTNYQLH